MEPSSNTGDALGDTEPSHQLSEASTTSGRPADPRVPAPALTAQAGQSAYKSPNNSGESDASRTNSPKKKKFRRHSNDPTGPETKKAGSTPKQPRKPFTSPTSSKNKKAATASSRITGSPNKRQPGLELSKPPPAVNSKSPFFYSTSEDQYEESEEYDNSGEENLSSDTSSAAPFDYGLRRPIDGGPCTPYRWKRHSSRTSTSETQPSPGHSQIEEPEQPQYEPRLSRNSSLSTSAVSQDSTVTVTLPHERTSPEPAGVDTLETIDAEVVAPNGGSTSTAPISPTSTPISPSFVPVYAARPEKLDLNELKHALSTGSTSISTPRDRKLATTQSGNANSMTVETETVPAVPLLAVAAGTGPASIKLRRSIDNVNKSLMRGKKKKSNRAGTSKAEVFAARIASAVDEFQSSDSDETFVYESNPHDMPPGSSSSVRPRFNARSPSSSSLQQPSIASQLHLQVIPPLHTQNSDSSLPVNQPQSPITPGPSTTEATAVISANGPDSYQTLTQSLRSNAQKQFQQIAVSQQPGPPEELRSAMHAQASQILHESGHALSQQPSLQSLNSSSQAVQLSPYGAKSHDPHSTSSDNLAGAAKPPIPSVPMQATESAPSFGTDPLRPLRKSAQHLRTVSTSGTLGTVSPRSKRGGLGSASRIGLKKQASSQLRSLSSKHFDSLNGGYKSTGQYPRGFNRNGYNEEDMDDEDMYNDLDEDFDDDDEDEYYEYSETTPLRMGGPNGGGGGPGSVHGGSAGQRRLRKHGVNSLRSYSPHNYQRNRGAMSRYHRLRTALWFTLSILAILSLGFMMGFLLATTKPLHSVAISDILDVLVSDEELMFDVVIQGINPGFLSIEVSEVDLDVFARSPYVKDEQYYLPADATDPGSGGGGGSGGGKNDKLHTMLLGNIQHFEVPLTFEGGVFSRNRQKSVGQLRLVHPGRNTTAPHGGDDNNNSSGDKTLPKTPSNGGGGGDFDGDDDFSAVSTQLTVADASPDPPNGGGEEDDDDGSDMDSGQKRWTRVSLKPFDLIVRGVLRYELILSPTVRVASISKVSL